MMTSIEQRIAQQRVSSSEDAYRSLGQRDRTAFGELMFGLYPRSNGYDKHLPEMASEEAQIAWTGSAGRGLLEGSISFIRTVMTAFITHTGRSPATSRILDYGCGYGSVARLCYFFTDPQNVYGVDPWDQSIKECRDRGLGHNFVQSDFVPTSLPVHGLFDLIYAFSVFTHLSRKTTLQSLATLRRYCAPNGLLCITIRPKEFWSIKPDVDAAALIKTHETEGSRSSQ
jgi:SAM-dependent methyltransferase